MAEGEVNGAFPHRGRVSQVRNQWLIHEDGAIAHVMQEEEFCEKYGRNRYNRRTARGDVPVAKVVQSEEEERLQLEMMERLEQAKHIADHDAAMAQQVYQQMMEEEEEQLKQREQEDEEVARKMQEREKEKFERKMQERVLVREQKRVEKELQKHTQEYEGLLSSYKQETEEERALRGANNIVSDNDVNREMENLRMETAQPDKLLRKDGKVEDLGDFSDFYIQPDGDMDLHQRAELQQMQDEELARLLQEQEHKRGAILNRDKLKAIEAQDEELAKIIQEKEKLRLKKHMQRKAQKQLEAQRKLEEFQEQQNQQQQQQQHQQQQQQQHQQQQQQQHRHQSRQQPPPSNNYDSHFSQPQRVHLPDSNPYLTSDYLQRNSQNSFPKSVLTRDAELARRLQQEEEASVHYKRQMSAPSGGSQKYYNTVPSRLSDSSEDGFRPDMQRARSEHHKRPRQPPPYRDPPPHPASNNHHGNNSFHGNALLHGSALAQAQALTSGGIDETYLTPRQTAPLPSIPIDHSPLSSPGERHFPGDHMTSHMTSHMTGHMTDRTPSPASSGGGYGASSDEAPNHHRQSSMSDSPPIPGAPNNVFAAVDPTFQGENDFSPVGTLQSQSSDTMPSRPAPRMPPTATGAAGGEDGYCDLDDIQSQFAPVQGQRRTTLKKEPAKKGSKKEKSKDKGDKSNCKQQ